MKNIGLILALAFAIIVTAMVWMVLGRPTEFDVAGADVPSIIYLVMTAVLFGSGALWASRRARAHGAQGPGAVTSLLIWFGLIGVVVLIYRGAETWSLLGAMFR